MINFADDVQLFEPGDDEVDGYAGSAIRRHVRVDRSGGDMLLSSAGTPDSKLSLPL
jgi:hypothetical protein